MRRLIAVAMAAAAAIALAPGPPATAGSTWPESWLRVTIEAPRTPGPSTRTEPVTAWLTCDPPAGSHPYAAEACGDLTAARGDIAAIDAGSAGCGGVWQPVEISARGRWHGTPVQFAETASNEGCAVISHGYVFRLPLS